MVLFKIYGERNSGTNYLKRLMEKNFGHSLVAKETVVKNIAYYYVHNIPLDEFKLVDEKVVDIVIFRRLDSWLISMFFNPHNLEKKRSFEDFLTSGQEIFHGPKILDFKTGQTVNYEDEGNTIFEIRYHKMEGIFRYFERNPNVILVSLEYLQEGENYQHFLRMINERYQVNRKRNYQNFKIHTKTGRTDIKNRDYNLEIERYREIIERYKDEEYENFVNNLRVIFKE